jgi:hypothetical protein
MKPVPGKGFAPKVHNSAAAIGCRFSQLQSRHDVAPSNTLAPKVLCFFRDEAVTRADLSYNFPWGPLVRRHDLLKADVMSEVILVAIGAVLFAILVLVFITALTRTLAQF